MAKRSAKQKSARQEARRAPARKKTAKNKTAKNETAKKSAAKKKTSKKKTSKKKTSKKSVRSTVDRWVGRLSREHQRIVDRLRKIIRAKAPHLEEAIKWSQPVYSGRGPICYIMARSTGHVTFGFWNGKQIEDPDGVLEGAGGRMRHVKLSKPGDVATPVLERLIEQAIAIDAQA